MPRLLALCLASLFLVACSEPQAPLKARHRLLQRC